MIDHLFHVGLSNACFAFVLAVLATFVGVNLCEIYFSEIYLRSDRNSCVSGNPSAGNGRRNQQWRIFGTEN